jgi:hypothetical protein
LDLKNFFPYDDPHFSKQNFYIKVTFALAKKDKITQRYKLMSLDGEPVHDIKTHYDKV